MVRRLDVKICGLSTRETIDAALGRGATHVGFVHFPKSPRHLELASMAELVAHVGRRAQTVIVLVDPQDALLDAIARDVRPDWLQLHGRESPDRVAEAKARTGLKVMKAISVATREDLESVADYRTVADAILLDSKRPKGSDLPGGNGVSFDWRILSGLGPETPYLLSGGLSAENVREAIGLVSPAGVDISSGVESAPGIKDAARIHAFFDALAPQAVPAPFVAPSQTKA